MSISPFSARPVTPDGESRRTRLVLVLATVGIAATLLAYGFAPGVRHAVGHAAHSVRHAVGHVLDRDAGRHREHRLHLVAPLRVAPPKPGGRAKPDRRPAPAGVAAPSG